VAALSEIIRKTTTFLLAVFVWLHALFLLNVQTSLVTKSAYYLRLTISETILLALLVVFSFASGSGFWKPFRSLLYIYAFPFVLFWRLLYWAFLSLRALHRWFKAQADQPSDAIITLEQKGQSIAPTPLPPDAAPTNRGIREDAKDLAKFLLRPFRRFMLLWCILLLVATHIQIVWICLSVVIVHLARRIFILLKVMLFSDPYLKKAIARAFETVGNAIDVIDAFTPDTSPSNEIRTNWNNLNNWKRWTDFLRDDYLVSRWTWVIGALSFGLIYLYFSFLFSFLYFGVARVSGISYAWKDSLVASLFIPLFATELPKTFFLRLLGGMHFLLAVTVGISTFFSFLKRRLFVIRTAAVVINDRLGSPTFQEKFSMVGAKLAESPASSPQQKTQAQEGRGTKTKNRKKSR
jgi:hypothetical protein